MILTARQTRIALDLLTGFVVVSIGVALAGLSWRLAGFPGSAGAPIVPAARPAAPATDVAPAIASALFGRPDTTVGAQPTTLGLELRGVLLTVPRAASTALIAPTGGKPIAYAVGQAVPGAILEEIALDHVILRVGARAELLAFPKATAPVVGAAAPVAAAGAVPATGPSDARPMQPIAPAVAPASPAPAAGLLDALGATPSEGGYRIAPGSAVAERYGLRGGDLIQSLNGVALGDPLRDRQTVAAAQASGPMRVELLRGGQRITLSVPVR